MNFFDLVKAVAIVFETARIAGASIEQFLKYLRVRGVKDNPEPVEVVQECLKIQREFGEDGSLAFEKMNQALARLRARKGAKANGNG